MRSPSRSPRWLQPDPRQVNEAHQLPQPLAAGVDSPHDCQGRNAAGDSMMGASLVVHAINHGRQAAAAIDAWLRSR